MARHQAHLRGNRANAHAAQYQRRVTWLAVVHPTPFAAALAGIALLVWRGRLFSRDGERVRARRDRRPQRGRVTIEVTLHAPGGSRLTRARRLAGTRPSRSPASEVRGLHRARS